MKTWRYLLTLFLILVLAACSAPGSALPITPATPAGVVAPTETTAPTSTVLPTQTLEPTQTPVPSLTPPLAASPTPVDTVTPRPTPTPDPALYQFESLGDIRQLDSFVLTIRSKTSHSGSTGSSQSTASYNRQPLSIQQISSTTTDGETYQNESYLLGAWLYQKSNMKEWHASPTNPDNTELSVMHA